MCVCVCVYVHILCINSCLYVYILCICCVHLTIHVAYLHHYTPIKTTYSIYVKRLAAEEAEMGSGKAVKSKISNTNKKKGSKKKNDLSLLEDALIGDAGKSALVLFYHVIALFDLQTICTNICHFHFSS